MSLAWPTRDARPPRAIWGILAAAMAVLILAPTAGLTPAIFHGALEHGIDLLKKVLVKPDLSYLPTLGLLLFETVAIAYVSTLLAIAFSFPLGFLMAAKTTPGMLLAVPLRFLVAVVRAVPDLMWALAFVAAVGLGPIAGVAALAITGIGSLAKFQQESLDVVSNRPIEGVDAQGAGWLARRLFGVVPQAMPDLVGQWMYTMDSNMRSATILGMVGAGGIGFDFSDAVKLERFDRLGSIVIGVYLVVTILDRLSDRIRRRLI